MIQVNGGKVVIEGAVPAVHAEMATLLSHFIKVLEAKFGKGMAEEIFNMIVEDAKKSDEELDKEVEELKKQANDLLKDILKTIMEGLGE